MDIAERLGGLADGDLLALRLASQVLGHKAGLLGRPAVAGWFGDLGQAVNLELARRGVGLVIGRTTAPRLAAMVDPADRLLLGEHLGLLADNTQLSAAVRGLCGELREQLG